MRVGYKKERKLAYDGSRHWPGATEAKVVRQLRAKYKLTEKEVRSCKEFRQEIAQALVLERSRAFRSSRSSGFQINSGKYLVQKIVDELGLHHNHPEVQAEYDKRVEACDNPYYHYPRTFKELRRLQRVAKERHKLPHSSVG